MSAALNNIFSRDFFQSLVDMRPYPLFDYAVSRYTPKATNGSRLEALQTLYRYMYKRHRCEYIYKNTLIRRIVLGRHNINTCAAFSEFRIKKAKADIVAVNGTATAYEIKTDLDNLVRLDHQIEDYYKVFDRVMLVVSEAHTKKLLNKYESTPVGISTLSTKGYIHEIKPSEAFKEALDNEAIFSVLRKREYEAILANLDIDLPRCPDALYYRSCKAIFSDLSPEVVYPLFLKTLKARTACLNSSAITSIPDELKLLGYIMNVSPHDADTLNYFLHTTF